MNISALTCPNCGGVEKCKHLLAYRKLRPRNQIPNCKQKMRCAIVSKEQAERIWAEIMKEVSK